LEIEQMEERISKPEDGNIEMVPLKGGARTKIFKK